MSSPSIATTTTTAAVTTTMSSAGGGAVMTAGPTLRGGHSNSSSSSSNNGSGSDGGGGRRRAGGGAIGSGDVVLDIPTWACMVESRVSFVFANHTTHSDVMSVKVTSRLFTDDGERRPIKSASGLPLRRLHLPAPRTLPIHPAFSTSKKSKQLIRERDAFMARLRREREERHIRENLAAVRIQAVWRGQQVRPKPKAARRRKRREEVAPDWREELRALTLATEETINGPADEKSDWRRGIQKKASAKRSRKMRRAAEYHGACLLNAVVRGFLARRAFRVLLRHHTRRVQAAAVVRIQAMARGFTLRRSLAIEVTAKRQRAAVVIQAMMRGMHARIRCRWLMRAMRQAQEEAAAATTIQCAMRTSRARQAVQHKRETKAAIRMQSSVRGFAARRDVRQVTTQRREAATQIQAVGRGYIVRAEYGDKIAEAQARRQEREAAVLIQSVARGRTARHTVAAKRRQAAAQRKKQAEDERRAAVKMQSAARGRLARRRVDSIRQRQAEQDAATKVQSIARGKAARRRVAAKRTAQAEARAATKMQSAARGKAARKRVARIKSEREHRAQAAAATRISAAARGRAARKQVGALRQSRRKELEAQASDAPRRRRKRK